MEKTVALILAIDEQNGLGKGNTLAWRLKGDMAYFKEITSTTLFANKKNAVVMGRHTWESIPEKFRPLPNRKNYIMTRDENFTGGDGVFHSLEQCLETLDKDESIENIFLIGGAQVYNEAINKDIPDTIYLTQIFDNFGCDTFFIGVPDNYTLESISEKQEENDIKYKFIIYQKTHKKTPLTTGKTLWETKAPDVTQTNEELTNL